MSGLILTAIMELIKLLLEKQYLDLETVNNLPSLEQDHVVAGDGNGKIFQAKLL